MSNDSHSQNHGEPAHAHSGTHHHTTPTGHSSSSSRQSNESLYRAFLDYLKEDAVVNVPSHHQTIVTDHHKPYTAATILDEIKEVTHPEQRMHGKSVSDEDFVALCNEVELKARDLDLEGDPELTELAEHLSMSEGDANQHHHISHKRLEHLAKKLSTILENVKEHGSLSAKRLLRGVDTSVAALNEALKSASPLVLTFLFAEVAEGARHHRPDRKDAKANLGLTLFLGFMAGCLVGSLLAAGWGIFKFIRSVQTPSRDIELGRMNPRHRGWYDNRTPATQAP